MGDFAEDLINEEFYRDWYNKEYDDYEEDEDWLSDPLLRD